MRTIKNNNTFVIVQGEKSELKEEEFASLIQQPRAREGPLDDVREI